MLFKNIMRKCSLLIIALIFLQVNVSIAQVDKKANAILAGVSAKYKSYKSITVDFAYTLENPAAKIKETQTGNLILSGAKYRLNIAGQEVICDGKTTWTIMKEAKEVQVNSVDANEEGIKPAEIFTMYDNGAKVLQNLELTPTDKSKAFFKVKLSVDKASKQLVKSIIFDKNGNRYTYAIKSFKANTPTTAATFSFDPKKYPGVELVDLR